MKKILYTICFLLITCFAKSQVYQVMPQYGYGPVKRFDVDSALTIPTTCGTPIYRSNLLHKSAIAFDTCNNRFYFYNSKTLVWDTIKGGGGGSVTTSDTAKVIVALVTNAESTTLLKGEVVYLYQATGNRASVKRARNLHDSTSAKTFGIVRDDISAGGTGIVVTQGVVDKLSTQSFTEGTTLYLDSIAGQYTATKPKAPYHLVYVGIVERANNGNGQVYVRCQNGYELDEIHDVQINSAVDGNTILYNSASKVWKNTPYNLGTVLDYGNVSYTRPTQQNRNIILRDTINNQNAYLNLSYGGSNTSIVQYQSGYYQSNLGSSSLSLQRLFPLGGLPTSGSSLGYNGQTETSTNPLGQSLDFYRAQYNTTHLLTSKMTNTTPNNRFTNYLPETNGVLTSSVRINGTTYTTDNSGLVNLGTISGSGSTGVNGLNGTTNIGLGGNLVQNTTILPVVASTYSLTLGTTGYPLSQISLNGESIRMESINPRHTSEKDKMVVVVMDTANNNTIRTMPLSAITSSEKVLRGKFSCVNDGSGGYILTWQVIYNTTGVDWTLNRISDGVYLLIDNVIDNTVSDQFNECTWFGGVMFPPNGNGDHEYIGQMYNDHPHYAVIKIFSYDPTNNDYASKYVSNACFELRLYDKCDNGDTTIPK